MPVGLCPEVIPTTMTQPIDGLVHDLKKALHHAQKNNQPEQARHLARLLTEALTPSKPNVPSPSGNALNIDKWSLTGDVDPSGRN